MEIVKAYPSLSVTHYGRHKYQIETELGIRNKRCPGYAQPGQCIHYRQSGRS